MTYGEKKLLLKLADKIMEKDGDDELKTLVDVLTKPSKVFVYGTLRREGAKEYVISGYRLETVANAGHMFPILVKSEGSFVKGNIVTYDPDDIAHADRYENCGSLYDRKLITVMDGDDTFDAWVYLPLDPGLMSDKNVVIESGDWIEWKKSQVKTVEDSATKQGEDMV